MITRSFWVLLHRWSGLAMGGFLVIVGLTGSLIAFREELDVWLNPELMTVPIRDMSLLDPLQLRERAEALEPRIRVDGVSLARAPGRAMSISFAPRMDPQTGKPFELPFNEIFLDPYTGEKLGERETCAVSLAKENVICFIYRIHTSLALPASAGSVGGWLLGGTALIWTIDCFVSFYLTFPLRRRDRASAFSKSWWGRWKPAWVIKLGAGAYRINFDIHRAFGLWTFVMLFVFAWSSVFFNLNFVYVPVMSLAFDMTLPAALPDLETPLESPALGWREALARGRELVKDAGAQHGFTTLSEQSLSLERAKGVYTYMTRSSRDFGRRGDTVVAFDANSGAFKSLTAASTVATGWVVTQWLVSLHMAQIFGRPMQVFVCAMGFVITALSATGVVIWWKKRAARKFRARQDMAAVR